MLTKSLRHKPVMGQRQKEQQKKIICTFVLNFCVYLYTFQPLIQMTAWQFNVLETKKKVR